MSEPGPAKTFAIVVGIERYAAGDLWTLDGPANDAVRFATWLTSRSVPKQHIALLVSPSAANQTALNALGREIPSASRDAVRQAITSWLPTRGKDGALLIFYWVGHGVITADGNRRLFYANAARQDMANLDLTSLLTSLRTDVLTAFPRQIYIVDACANYFEHQRQTIGLPSETFAVGVPVNGREQFVLLGASIGERAKTDPIRKTDLFSHEVLARLAREPASSWPPDMERVRDEVASRFVALRAQGRTRQTPACFWYRSWQGGEGSLGDLRSLSAGLPPAAYAYGPTLAIEQKIAVAKALLACPTVADRARRQTVLSQLPPDIALTAPRDAADLFDVLNLVSTCLNYSEGLEQLTRAVRLFEGDSIAMQGVDTLLGEYPRHSMP